MEAYLSGLEKAAANGKDLSQIHSVASFFVSRVDTEVDKQLDAIGTPEATALKGQAAVANARLAFEAYEEIFAGERFAALKAKGANPQRPLWASTGVKDPNMPDTLYVTELVVAGTVNTMPEKTMDAVADHGEITGDTVHGTYDEARATMQKLADQGISYDEVVETLEVEGVQKFEASWDELVEGVEAELGKARS
jgi:transaldolase